MPAAFKELPDHVLDGPILSQDLAACLCGLHGAAFQLELTAPGGEEPGSAGPAFPSDPSVFAAIRGVGVVSHVNAVCWQVAGFGLGV